VNTKHGFLFDREEIAQQIDALYELENAVMHALAEDEGEDPSTYDEAQTGGIGRELA
jgi:hypothetical protein